MVTHDQTPEQTLFSTLMAISFLFLCVSGGVKAGRLGQLHALSTPTPSPPGSAFPKPPLISQLEQGAEPCLPDQGFLSCFPGE